MHGQIRGRIPRVVIATSLFLIVSLNSPPTLPSVPGPRPAPLSPEEIHLLEELAEWVQGPADLIRAVQSNRQSFELFRRYVPPAARYDLLARHFPYSDLIEDMSRRYHVDSLLLASIIEAESGFNPYAMSARGALGLMQVMPESASFYPLEDLLEPEVNIQVGARYLAGLMQEFDGDVALALASYNAGPGMVKRYGGLPPFPETRRYVDRVLTRYVRLQSTLWQSSGASELLF
jgi:soluble lytic murein transglycosylase-like protein